jgi:hypothetical protein
MGGTGEPRLANAQYSQAIVPVPGKGLRFDRLAAGIGKHRHLRCHVERLQCSEHANDFGESSTCRPACFVFGDPYSYR